MLSCQFVLMIRMYTISSKCACHTRPVQTVSWQQAATALSASKEVNTPLVCRHRPGGPASQRKALVESV